MNSSIVKLYPTLLDINRYILKLLKLNRGRLNINIYKYLIFINVNFLDLLKKISAEDIQRLQNILLTRVLKSASSFSWWNQRIQEVDNISNSFQVLSKIKPVSKFDFLEESNGKDFISNSFNNKNLIIRRTSGSSTGVPFYWGHEPSSLYVSIPAFFFRELKVFGIDYNSTIKNSEFYVQYNFADTRQTSPFTFFFLKDFKIDSYDVNRGLKLLEMVNMINKNENCFLRTTTNEISWLFHELKRRNLSLKLTACLVVGGFLDKKTRSLYESFFLCPVIVHYGSQETGPFSIECGLNNGYYHIFSERVIVEVLNEENLPLLDGKEGNITITVLDNITMPLIRYQLGDRGVIFRNHDCGCGNTSPLIKPSARNTDYIFLSDGRKDTVQKIYKRIGSDINLVSIIRYQIKQDQIGSVKVLIESLNKINEKDLIKLKNDIRKVYKNKLETIHIEETKFLVKGGSKFKVFIPLEGC